MVHRSLDLEALVAALDARRKSEDISWRSLAKEVGVSASTLTRMQQGKQPDVTTLLALVQWLGMTTEDFVSAPASRAPDQAAVVASLLRSEKPEKITPAVREALDDLVHAAIKLSRHLRGKDSTR